VVTPQRPQPSDGSADRIGSDFGIANLRTRVRAWETNVEKRTFFFLVYRVSGPDPLLPDLLLSNTCGVDSSEEPHFRPDYILKDNFCEESDVGTRLPNRFPTSEC
jgi:hypothetical protein